MEIPHKITELLDEKNIFKDEIIILNKKMQEIKIKIGKELLVSDEIFRKYFENICLLFEKYGKTGMFRNYLNTDEKEYLHRLSVKLKMEYYEIVTNMLKDKFGYDFKFSFWTDGTGLGDFTYYSPLSDTTKFWCDFGWTENIYHTNIDEDSDYEDEYDSE
jgi:hypothetical protein